MAKDKAVEPKTFRHPRTGDEQQAFDVDRAVQLKYRGYQEVGAKATKAAAAKEKS